MEAKRWGQIKEVYDRALDLGGDEREGFLAEACAGDDELRHEVESLLAAHEEAGKFLQAPAVEVAAREIVAGEITSTVAAKLPATPQLIGQELANYKIISLLGRGGMGEVYLAEDKRLHRKVALKMLPAQFTNDAERVRRFEREAAAASATNHPNIVTIHEIGQMERTHYLVTEFVAGETLRHRLTRGRMEVMSALEVSVQVAAALDAAHEAGIVHRDIKPENIMLRPDGLVKVLDFGLAKLTEPQTPKIDTQASTIAGVITESGVVMGTPRYMSPEQARGMKVDGRTDIFSLGVALYEMIAGRAPFEGATTADVIAAILDKEPAPLADNSPGLPGELERIVSKALRKEREDRYQVIKEMLFELKDLKRELELAAETGPGRLPDEGKGRRAAWRRWGAPGAVALGAIAVLAAVWYWRPGSGAGINEAALLKNASFTQLTDQAGPEFFPSLSPDGKSLVYASYASGNWDIYSQRVGGKNTTNLTRDSSADDTQPAFSPDGELIAIRSERQGGGIFVMGATGENVKRLTDSGFNPAWSPDGKWIACADEGIEDPFKRFHPFSRIWVVNVATGERKHLVTKEDAAQPGWSPHGVRIAYMGRRKGAQRDIWTIPAAGGEPVEVTNDAATDWNPVWSPDGYLYFASDRSGSMNIWRVPIEEQSGKVLGAPKPVTTPSTYSGHLSFSKNGQRMAYAQIVRRANLQRVGFDPKTETVTDQPTWITQGSSRANLPHVSPDGEWVAFSSQGGYPEDLFVVRRDGTGLRRLTEDIHKDRAPRWSPDGRRIAFHSDRSGKWEIWMINPDGSGLQQITHASGTVTGAIWSPDGTRLAYRNLGGPPSVVEVGRPWEEQAPQTLPSLGDSSMETWSWSPDGRRLVGVQRHSDGRIGGIFVYSFETQQYEKLTDFGGSPFWLSDSRRLLFAYRNKIFLVDSQTKRVREVLSLTSQNVGIPFTLSRDDRQIYFSLITTEADIWLMTLE